MLFSGKNIVVYIIITIFLIAGAMLVKWNINTYKEKVINEKTHNLNQQLKTTVQGIEFMFNEHIEALNALSKNKQIISAFIEENKTNNYYNNCPIENQFEQHKKNIDEFMLINLNGIKYHSHNNETKLLKNHTRREDLSQNKNIIYVLQNSKPQVSNVYVNENNERLISVFEPVIYKGKTIGIVAFNFYINKFLSNYIEPLNNELQTSTLVDGNEIFISHPIDTFIGKNAFNILSYSIKGLSFIDQSTSKIAFQRIINHETGSAIIPFLNEKHKKSSRLVSFHQLNLGNKTYSLTLSTDLDNVLKPARQYTNKTYTSFLFLTILFLFISFYLITSLKTQLKLKNEADHLRDISKKSIEIENQKKEFEALYEEYKSLNEELELKNKKIKESEERFRKFFEINQAIMLQIDVKTKKITNANKAACKYYSYSHSEIIKKTIAEIHTLPLEEINKRMKKAIESPSNNFEFKHKMANGEVRDVEVYASPIKINEKLNMFIIVHDITDKKNAFELLKNNEQRLKRLANLTFEGILIHDNGVAIDANESFLKMFELTRDEILDKNLIEILVPEKYRTLIYKKNEADYSEPYHLEMIKKSGVVFPVEIEAQKIFYENKFVRVTAIRDISNIQKAEADLIKSNQKLALHIEQTPLGVIEWDLDFNVLSWNKSAEDIFGYKAKEAVGKQALFIVPDQYKTHVEKVWNKLITDKVSNQSKNENISKDGSIINCHWYNTPLINQDNKVIGITSLVMDITKQRTAKKEMKKLSIAVNQSPTTIVITDINGSIEYVNPQFSKLTGYTYKEAIGQNPRILKSGKTPPGTFENMWKTILSGNIWQGEFINLKKNGEEFVEKAIIAPIKDDKNNIVSFMSIKEDITKQKEDENKLINKSIELEDAEEKLQAYNEELITTNQALEDNMEDLIEAKEKAEESGRLKSAFLANMSHEIRTPMNGIIGFIQLLKNPDLNYNKRTKFMDIIEKSGTQLLSIINDIVDISKIESGQINIHKKEININSFLDNLYNTFKHVAKDKGIELSVYKDLDKQKCIITNDETRLNQIIVNLLNNAIKFTHSGRIEFGYKLKNQLLEFYVSDTGIGIKNEDQEKIFERFRQLELATKRQYGGTGLGLAISKAIVGLIGEKIWLTSKFGVGSNFYFSIQYNPIKSVSRSDKEVSYKDNSNWSNKTILIAEDEESNFLYLKELLHASNAILIRAHNGLEAIQKVQTNKIDLILMDIKMPIMDGKEASMKIKIINPEIPIIAQTAFAMEGDAEAILESGCNDYITKPIKIDYLFEKIGRFIDT